MSRRSRPVNNKYVPSVGKQRSPRKSRGHEDSPPWLFDVEQLPELPPPAWSQQSSPGERTPRLPDSRIGRALVAPDIAQDWKETAARYGLILELPALPMITMVQGKGTMRRLIPNRPLPEPAQGEAYAMSGPEIFNDTVFEDGASWEIDCSVTGLRIQRRRQPPALVLAIEPISLVDWEWRKLGRTGEPPRSVAIGHLPIYTTENSAASFMDWCREQVPSQVTLGRLCVVQLASTPSE